MSTVFHASSPKNTINGRLPMKKGIDLLKPVTWQDSGRSLGSNPPASFPGTDFLSSAIYGGQSDVKLLMRCLLSGSSKVVERDTSSMRILIESSLPVGVESISECLDSVDGSRTCSAGEPVAPASRPAVAWTSWSTPHSTPSVKMLLNLAVAKQAALHPLFYK